MLTKLRKKMHKFGSVELKNFLGDKLISNLLEWTPDNEPLLTKAKLTEMILSINGISILKNDTFRLALYRKFTLDELHSFYSIINRSFSQGADHNEVIEKLAAYPWKKNDVSLHLAKLLNIPEDIFNRQTIEKVTREEHLSQDPFYELLDYQFVIKQQVLSYVNSGNVLNRMLLHMPTGTGKTKTAMHIINHHYNFNLQKQGLIIWLAHTTELLEQAYDTFKTVWSHLGHGSVIVQKLWGEHNIDENYPYTGVAFCGIQKLISLSNSYPKIFDNLVMHARLIVFDEAHKAAAEETKKMVESFMIKKTGMHDRHLLGLTATPGRATEFNFSNDLLVSMFGNKKIGINMKVLNSINMSELDALNTDIEDNIVKYFQNRRILAKIKKEELHYPDSLTEVEFKKIKTIATANGYSDFSEQALKLIGRKKSRNLNIIRRLQELNNDNIPTIVFACSVEHGQLLASMLTLADVQNALIIGSMSPCERAKIIQDFKNREHKTNILINYEVLTTGFDATNIKCVFITRPTQSVVLYSQMIGRGLRGPLMGGNEECLLIDVKDNLASFDSELAFEHFNTYWNQ